MTSNDHTGNMYILFGYNTIVQLTRFLLWTPTTVLQRGVVYCQKELLYVPILGFP